MESRLMKLKWNCFSDNFQFAKPFERGEIFSQRAFLIFTDIRKLQEKAETSYVLSPIRCKTLLDGGRRRTKNLYGVFKRTVPAGQVRQ